ncbi:hypothetical protein DFS33DRAFT_1383253 [Desarmillaria ectypa]|nr:hypothetical protein DFS33DRAFT_1383251 [Desarmillaria ectypa]KAK0205353.1 hypothetical protein DFS33DRAFT_1383253 [Desarmillaria ectypa]
MDRNHPYSLWGHEAWPEEGESISLFSLPIIKISDDESDVIGDDTLVSAPPHASDDPFNPNEGNFIWPDLSETTAWKVRHRDVEVRDLWDEPRIEMDEWLALNQGDPIQVPIHGPSRADIITTRIRANRNWSIFCPSTGDLFPGLQPRDPDDDMPSMHSHLDFAIL